MSTARLEAFSDGVLAIIITIMVLELRVPHEPTLAALKGIAPVFGSYVLSFVYVGIYWNNHHHLFQITERVSGGVLWANLHLLFWLSLIPFVTAWTGENGFARVPVTFYAVVLLLCAVAFNILQKTIVRVPGTAAGLHGAVRIGTKEKVSTVAYLLAIPAALFVHPAVAGALFVAVAAMWLIPDPRIERAVAAAQA